MASGKWWGLEQSEMPGKPDAVNYIKANGFKP